MAGESTNQGPDRKPPSSPDALEGNYGEEELRLILEGITEYAIVTIGLDGRVKSWNTGAEHILGYSEAEIVGRKAEVFFTPEDRARNVPEQEMQLAREEGRASNERWHVRKDGSRFWGSGFTLPLGRGHLRGYLKIFRDWTAEREAEVSLRARTAELETVLETVPVAVWFTHDPEARTVTGNSSAATLVKDFGVADPSPWLLWQAQLPGHFRIFVEGVEATPGSYPIERAARGEEIRDCEVETRFDDGHVLTFLVQANPLRDDEGRTIGAVAAATDITERKRFEKVLEESEEKFRQLADNIPAMAWMAGPDGVEMWHNKRWFDYTGVTTEEIVAGGLKKVFEPDAYAEIKSRWQTSLATGVDFEMVLKIKGRDGVYRTFLTRSQPLRDSQGRITRWFGTNVDISERVRAEEHQRLLINELNHRVKNTLAMVQSIAAHSFRGCDPSGEGVRQVFERRLMALSRAHDVLTRENWEGASLRTVVREAIAPHSDGQRFRIAGPGLRLKPRMALSLAMALSELTTNAAKYGSLSVEGGHVAIAWSVSGAGEEQHLHLRWSEHGGPPVTPPKRTGFGMRLIERSMRHDLAGDVRVDYAPSGLVCTVDAPLMLPDGESALEPFEDYSV